MNTTTTTVLERPDCSLRHMMPALYAAVKAGLVRHAHGEDLLHHMAIALYAAQIAASEKMRPELAFAAALVRAAFSMLEMNGRHIEHAEPAKFQSFRDLLPEDRFDEADRDDIRTAAATERFEYGSEPNKLAAILMDAVRLKELDLDAVIWLGQREPCLPVWHPNAEDHFLSVIADRIVEARRLRYPRSQLLGAHKATALNSYLQAAAQNFMVLGLDQADL